jgi:hypothetical protein
MIIHAAATDDKEKKAKLKECFGKEMDKENKDCPADLKLQDDQMKKLKKIICDEIDKEPWKKHTPEEQNKCYEDMETAAKKDMPEVKKEAVDKILHKVKDMSMHCLKEIA